MELANERVEKNDREKLVNILHPIVIVPFILNLVYHRLAIDVHANISIITHVTYAAAGGGNAFLPP